MLTVGDNSYFFQMDQELTLDMFSPLPDSHCKIGPPYLPRLRYSSTPETRLFLKAIPHTVDPVGTHIVMPSPGVEWREPLDYFWILIGYDIVHGIVMTISHVMGS